MSTTVEDARAASPVIVDEDQRDSTPPPLILRGVHYGTYVALRNADENRHMRMTYYDGTLELDVTRVHP